jgi:hypothetical protein
MPLANPYSQTPEEIHICKLLHLLYVACFGYLFIVKEDPGCGLLFWDVLADEGDVVSGRLR